MDRENEMPAEVHIEGIEGKEKPDPLTPAAVNEGLNMAGLFVAGATHLFARWSTGFTKHSNQLPLFDPEVSNAAGGDNNITYYHSHWKLKIDEALVIESHIPNCDHWNFQLNNYWMESLDYRYFDVCVNKGNAVLMPDGRVRIVVSASNPGLPNTNWLDTCSHDQGTMCWRWYRADKPHADLPQPQCKVMKLSELKDLA
jgi:hypothetical protein